MGISKVQSNAVGTNTAGTSIAGTLTTGITQGNLVIAEVKTGGQNQTITPPDASWTLAVRNAGSSGVAVTNATYFLIVDAAHAGQTSWTWTFGASHTMFVITSEWHATAGWPASPVNQTATNLGSTAATTLLAGTTATTTQAEELWVALWNYNGAGQAISGLTSGWTADASFSANSSNSSGQSAYEIAAATGVAAPSITIGVAEVWAGTVATFIDNTGNALASPGRARFQTRIAALATPARARFQTRIAALAIAARARFLTRIAALTTPARVRFLTRITALTTRGRARFLTRIAALATAARARFLIAMTLATRARARFLTRIVAMTTPARATFALRIPVLSAPARATFKVVTRGAATLFGAATAIVRSGSGAIGRVRTGVRGAVTRSGTQNTKAR